MFRQIKIAAVIVGVVVAGVVLYKVVKDRFATKDAPDEPSENK